MRSLTRYIPAFVLIVLYAMIVLSPLAPLALRSVVITHALTGECAGDCSLCACSPERSANHTCCCWQKKLQHEHDTLDDEQEQSDCCKKNQAGHKNKVPIISSRPCGSSKTMLLMGSEQNDILPFRFTQVILAVVETPLVGCNTACLADWPGDPPDPPPKLSILS